MTYKDFGLPGNLYELSGQPVPEEFFLLPGCITPVEGTEMDSEKSNLAFTAVMNVIKDPIWLLDTRGVMLAGNRAACKQFALDLDKLCGKRLDEVVPAEIAKVFIEKIRQVMEIKIPIQYIYQHEESWYEHIIHPVINKQEEVSYFVSLSRNISAQKILENTLQMYTSELESSVYQKTIALSKIIHGLKDEIRNQKTREKSLQNYQLQLQALSKKHDTVVEGVRTKIAHEIHDEFGHQLTVMKYDIEDLMTHQSPSEAEVKERLSAYLNMIDMQIDTVRKIATDLHPGILDHLGLIPAIEWQIKQFRSRTRVCCEYRPVEVSRSFNQEETIIIFRITQEVLTNIIRHSLATHVKVTIIEMKKQFQLIIIDNGIGFEMTDETLNESLGLLGMQERARSIGGKICIKSAPGKGTRVCFKMK